MANNRGKQATKHQSTSSEDNQWECGADRHVTSRDNQRERGADRHVTSGDNQWERGADRHVSVIPINNRPTMSSAMKPNQLAINSQSQR